MRWPETFEPSRMDRVAVVAPADRLRSVLVAVADAGVVQIERVADTARGPAGEALERARRSMLDTSRTGAVLDPGPPDIATLEREGPLGVLAGEAELESVSGGASRRGSVAALVGWSPTSALGVLRTDLAPLGGAVVSLTAPRGAEPPTQVVDKGATGAFQPLVDTYATIHYKDLNPSALAGLAYVVMFGMMFGDVGHGVILVAGGLLLRSGRPAALARLRHLSPFVIGGGLASVVFGLLYGEAFGPTGLVPTLWLRPLDHPTTLLAVAITVGAGLLAVSYVLGTINRWREGGAIGALLAVSGLAGASLYLGLAVVGVGWYRHLIVAEAIGGAFALAGLGFGFLGLYAAAGGRAEGVVQAGVELFDAVVRIGTNTVSFARLAAFGLTHAALCLIVWTATIALWHKGDAFTIVAVVVLVVGNALTFALEGLVAGVQAMRLEYYEMFSRIFTVEGRKFRPWHIPVVFPKEDSCSLG
jgi:V/A-type H+/Na+-transporting ATPase subunit I